MKRIHFLHMLVLAVMITFTLGSAWVPARAAQENSAIRIRFDRGATSAQVTGTLGANSSAQYVLRAMAGQLMDVSLTAPEGVSLAVTTKSGKALTPISGTGGKQSFRGYLPYNGDYYLTVTSAGKSVDFTLGVLIPVRVSFDLGATWDRLAGDLDPHQGLDYILWAAGGQVLEVNAVPESESQDLQLVIYGVDGTVLRSGMGEGSSYRGLLPASQDYIVTVRAAGDETSFTLDVIIPQRISFRPGAYSGSASNYLLKDGTHYFVISAMKNQKMQVEFTNDDTLQLVIYGLDGTILKGGNDLVPVFDGKLPSSQDYILVVTNTGKAVTSTVTVTIK